MQFSREPSTTVFGISGSLMDYYYTRSGTKLQRATQWNTVVVCLINTSFLHYSYLSTHVLPTISTPCQATCLQLQQRQSKSPEALTICVVHVFVTDSQTVPTVATLCNATVYVYWLIHAIYHHTKRISYIIYHMISYYHSISYHMKSVKPASM